MGRTSRRSSAALLGWLSLVAWLGAASAAAAKTGPHVHWPSRSVAGATAPTPYCLGWSDTAKPPDTIVVGHVVDGAVASAARTSFRPYVERALTGLLTTAGVRAVTDADGPALETAAIAVKQYAWHRALNHDEVGYSLADGTCYDVRDDARDFDVAAADAADPTLAAAVADAFDRTWTMSLRRPDLPEPFFLPRPSPGDASGCAPSHDLLSIDVPLANAIACAEAGEGRSDLLARYFGSKVRTVDAIEMAGPTRYETAVQVARTVLPNPARPTVYVASGETFPDALVAGPAAAAGQGVVLLVRAASIPAAVDAELIRLKPAEIRVIGGTGVISDAVVTALKQRASLVRRIAGLDRYRTALAVTASAFPSRTETVFVATGARYPDSLSAAAAAAMLHSPLLLVPSGPLDPNLRTALAGGLARLQPSVIHVVGGPFAVPEPTVDWLATLAPTIDRLAGADRYATSAAVSAAMNKTSSGRVSIVTGENFPDALVAATLTAPLLLVPGIAALPASPTVDEYTRIGHAGMTILGSSRIVRDRVVAALVGARTATSDVLLPAYFNEAAAAPTALDQDGIPVVSYNGVLEHNPVTVAQYGLASHAAWVRSHDGDAKATMLRMADWLVQSETADGRWLYTFPFASEPVPWWSGMAQGQAVSLLLRAYQATSDVDYRDAAARGFQALARRISNSGSTLVDRGDVWIEEYLPPYSTHTLNGFLFALEGVREMGLVTGDTDAVALYRAGIRTLHDFIPQFDSGTWSYYNIGAGRHLASLNYQLVHILELRHFSLIEDDSAVATYAARFAADVAARTGRAPSRPIRSWVTPLDVP